MNAEGAYRVLRWAWRYPCPVCEEPAWATSRLGLYERVRPGCPAWFHRRDRARWTVGGRRFPVSRRAERKTADQPNCCGVCGGAAESTLHLGISVRGHRYEPSSKVV